jgi:CBS domain-containing protein
MKVRDVMARHAVSCGMETNVAQAVHLMWEHGCGFLPVVGEGGNVIGVITDRDIAIALGTRGQRASEMFVRDVVSPKLFTCTSDDDVHTAMKTLRTEGIRRLPVIDREGALIGVFSIDDVSVKARAHPLKKDISYEDIEDTYKAILLHSSLSKERTRAAA